ncbi:MAG: SRPBCC domain-containing protein [Candidatus Marinimicrobia bacterium]|nr:SRPBCC domain-containing protein [Candidatus Neomarinimicrobiota bacterium]MCF7840469.1 SRPBCC domain-containing protein [Candidatus Neomarinimicrobiota bacterium]
MTSSDTVIEKTGKSLEEWFAILDRWGATTKGHPATAKYLASEWGVNAWWSQNITVEYEKARGLRVVGQRADGSFEVSFRRTLPAPVEWVYAAFTEPELLNRWFTHDAQLDVREGGSYRTGDSDNGVYKKVVPAKRLRFTWENPNHCPGSIVEIQFDAPSTDRCVLSLTHSKIKTQDGYNDMKAGWSDALDSLKALAESYQIDP